MSFLMFAALGAAVPFAVVYGRRALSPSCPRCGSRTWDRKLCRPLLLCRYCATRCDGDGRVYN